MNTELFVALAAGGFSILATVLSVLANGRIARSNDEASARRAYEYEARKRLYAEVEPLFFQLESAAGGMRDRALNLARASRMGVLGAGPASWLNEENYYLASTLHALLRPSIYCRLLERRITSIDLNLDRTKSLVFALLREDERALGADFDLAVLAPALDYNPNDTSELPMGDKGRFRQGLVAGRRENCVDALIVREAGEPPRAIGFGELESAMADESGSTRAKLMPVIAILLHFSPQERPVFWRIVVLKAVLARLILEVLDATREPPNLEQSARKILDHAKFRESLSTNPPGEPVDPGPFEAVKAYLEPRLASIMKRYARNARRR